MRGSSLDPARRTGRLLQDPVAQRSATMNAPQQPDHALRSPISLCPSWCAREHLGLADDACGFHHDGAVTVVRREGPPVPGGGDFLFVNVSQHEQHGGLGQAYVEVQDEHRTLALLTSGECVELARALLQGAQLLREEDAALESRLRPLIAKLEATLTSLVADADASQSVGAQRAGQARG